MNLDLKHIIQLGWPVLSVLLLFSIIALAAALQCWVVLRRSRWLLRYAPAERQALAQHLELVDGRLALLGTIANAAPFVGLLGTVIGIIRAFATISVNAGGGVASVAGGISEALFATAMGLAVAIPASMLYNFFSYRSQKIAQAAGLP
ncbi:MAG: MotA/TolQ/ExbB proton channel family protein [Elusimicrobiota bacterium]